MSGNLLTQLGGFIAGRTADAVNVIGALQERRTADAALKVAELQTQKARLEKEAAQAAAANTSKMFGSKTLENVVIWSLTAIASGVLVTIVLKAAGIK